MKRIVLIFLAIINIILTNAQKNELFTDSRDGKTYKTIKIGNQTWMAENLAYKSGGGSWAWNLDKSNVSIYGYLYNWTTAKKVCPAGWHLPTDKEWKMLIDSVGSDAGKKLKSTTGWINDGNGTDGYGFTALPGGKGVDLRMFVQFSDLEGNGYWWTASENSMRDAVARQINYSNNYASQSNFEKKYRFSVRCIKD